MIEYANEKLKNINFNEGLFEADFIVDSDYKNLNELIIDLSNGKEYYGQGCPEPIVIVKNIPVDIKSIQIIGSNKDTVKFEHNGIIYIQFKAKNLIDELNNYEGVHNITVAGRCNINNFANKQTPQIMIDGIEIGNKWEEF